MIKQTYIFFIVSVKSYSFITQSDVSSLQFGEFSPFIFLVYQKNHIRYTTCVWNRWAGFFKNFGMFRPNKSPRTPFLFVCFDMKEKRCVSLWRVLKGKWLLHSDNDLLVLIRSIPLREREWESRENWKLVHCMRLYPTDQSHTAVWIYLGTPPLIFMDVGTSQWKAVIKRAWERNIAWSSSTMFSKSNHIYERTRVH